MAEPVVQALLGIGCLLMALFLSDQPMAAVLLALTGCLTLIVAAVRSERRR